MVIFINICTLQMVSFSHCLRKNILKEIFRNSKTCLEKTTGKKVFKAWYLNYTWSASSKGKGLCLILYYICRLCHSTWHKVGAQWMLNERVNDMRSAPSSLSISTWSHLHLCEIGVTSTPTRLSLAYFDHLLYRLKLIHILATYYLLFLKENFKHDLMSMF